MSVTKKILGTLAVVLAVSASAQALEVKSRKLAAYYGAGWVVDGASLTPMTEQAADVLVALEKADRKKLTCDFKGVFKRNIWTESQNAYDFLAYSIENCQ